MEREALLLIAIIFLCGGFYFWGWCTGFKNAKPYIKQANELTDRASDLIQKYEELIEQTNEARKALENDGK